MTHTFKIRYANVLVGTLVLTVLALLVVATAFIGAKQKWFKSPYTLQAELPFRRSLGVKAGTSILLMDSAAGEVDSLHYSPDGHISATLRIREVFKHFIRTNAVGVVRKEFGVLGDVRIVIEQKEDGPTFADVEQTAPIPLRPDVDIVSALLKTADRVSADVPALVADARSSVSNLEVLTAQLADPDHGLKATMGEATATLRRVRLLLEAVQTGDGLPARVINDPAFAAGVNEVVTNLSRTLAAFHQTLATNLPPVLASARGTLDAVKSAADDARPLLKSSDEAMRRVPQAIDHADLSLRAAPDLILQLQGAIADLQTLLQGLQHNWFLKGGVEEAKRLEPANVSTNLFHP